MIGSDFVREQIPAYSGNFTKGRGNRKIQKVTIHHMAAHWTASRCGQSFQNKEKEASTHYGIGYEGEIAQYVSEEDTAWSDGNWDSNQTSVSIECANELVGEPWPVSDATLESLVLLLADISFRNGLGYFVKGENLTWHQMYRATACPGAYLLSKIDWIIERSNMLIAQKKETLPTQEKTAVPSYQVYHGSWLENVSGHDVSDAVNGYAGVLGFPISAISAHLSKGNLYYKVHVKGSGWLFEVKNREDYAGILSSPIDALMMRSDLFEVWYCVHTIKDGWLPAVCGYDAEDAKEGYAGILGHPIDAVMLWIEEKKVQNQVSGCENSEEKEQSNFVCEEKKEEEPALTWKEKVLRLLESILEKLSFFVE